MSGVTFNRKRVKLKKLLGIRARLAMLAVLLVAPLMFERVRSLEDTRAKQIATASEEYAEYHPSQRRDPARGDLLRRDDAEIRRLYPRGQRHRAQLRNPARQPARQPALDPQHHAREQGRRGAVFHAEHSGRHEHRRSRLFQEGAGNPRFRLQRLPVRQDQQPADHDGGLSGLRDQSGGRIGCSRRHQSRLAVEDHGQLQRKAGHFSAADRQHRRRAGGAARPGQHDRPAARQRAAAVGHHLQGAQCQLRYGLDFLYRDRRRQARRQFRPHSRDAIPPRRQRRRGQGDGRDQSRHSHRLSSIGVRLPVRAARRADRR